MKNFSLFIIIVSCFIATNAHSQTREGNFLVGASSGFNIGGASYSSISISYLEESASSERFRFNINPSVGYFVIGNLALGLNVYASYLKQDYSDASNRNFGVGGGPFVRYYFQTETILPFLELNGSYGYYDSKLEVWDSNFNVSNTNSYNLIIGGAGGFAIPLSNNATFDVKATYSYNSVNFDNFPRESKYHSLGLALGLTVFIGN